MEVEVEDSHAIPRPPTTSRSTSTITMVRLVVVVDVFSDRNIVMPWVSSIPPPPPCMWKVYTTRPKKTYTCVFHRITAKHVFWKSPLNLSRGLWSSMGKYSLAFDCFYTFDVGFWQKMFTEEEMMKWKDRDEQEQSWNEAKEKCFTDI